ncbi:helix-turn-helix domain-containing protein [Parahaliea mediterranea]|uniref:Helix-turn-helix domain-containing protein n=1 Tax=Parahaliea mediterranea TaxID=651086 RepID=A0A939IN41_9GAMM|nr:helix-turn-helix domain-containing protein [Parahaliea mediterranea]MBN7797703.1 helix-turn-helix domain-containing protein [Parahaliea mediterranea]
MFAVYDTASLDVADRQDYWLDFLRELYPPCEISFSSKRDFRCRAETNTIKAIQLAVGAGEAHAVANRSQSSVLPDGLTLNLSIAGTTCIEQNGQRFRLKPYEFVLLDQRRPYLIRHENDYQMMTLQIPRQLLVSRLTNPGMALGNTFCAGRGHGLVAARFLASLGDSIRELTAEDDRLLEDSIITIVANAINALGSPDRKRKRHADDLRQAKAVIERHFHEPGFGRTDVADASRLPVRELNRLFAAEGTSISRHIKSCRLRHAARLLTTPGLEGLSITEVAYRSGFNDISHFCQSFRGMHGMSPNEFRRKHPGDRATTAIVKV